MSVDEVISYAHMIESRARFVLLFADLILDML